MSKTRFAAGFLAVTLLGSLFHFAFAILGHSPAAAVFFTVNESVWEHMKLLAMAAFIWMTTDYFLARPEVRRRFCLPRAAALAAGLLTIPLLFYFIRDGLGVENLTVDIGIFVAAAALSAYLSLRWESRFRGSPAQNALGALILVAVFAAFAAFTFLPPRLPLFYDMSAGIYGIPR